MLIFKKLDSKLGEDITIYVGQNKEENWKLIDSSHQNNLWFHLADHPSCHVVINCDKKENISKNTIRYAGNLCKEYSNLKYFKKVSVIYTEIKNLKKGKEIGSVYTKKTKRIIL